MPAIGQHEPLSRCNAKSSESGPAASPSNLTTRGMTMLATAERLEEARSTQSLTSRYESLIRLAEAIRSHRDQKDLFQLLVDELRQVVPFDVMAQCDHAGNKVNWHFSEPYHSEKPVPHIPKEETVAWWVDRTQQPVVLQVSGVETRFPSTIELLNKVGLRSLCALPLSTAHSRLGSLVFASQIANAYSPEEVRFLGLVAGQIALQSPRVDATASRGRSSTGPRTASASTTKMLASSSTARAANASASRMRNGW